MSEIAKKTNTKKTTNKTTAKPKAVGRPKQSLARIGAKTVARTFARRAVTGMFGNGLVGALLGTLVSQGIKQTDKVEYNKDFGIFHKK